MEEKKKKNPLSEEQLKEVAAAGAEIMIMTNPDKFDKTLDKHIPHHVEFTPPTGDIEF